MYFPAEWRSIAHQAVISIEDHAVAGSVLLTLVLVITSV